MKLYFALGSMLAVCASASANLLTNGDFQHNAFTAPYQVLTGTQLYGWQIVGANVAGIVNPYLNAPNQEIDLSGIVDQGRGLNETGIAQTVATSSLKTYYLSFDVYTGGPNYTGGVDLLLNGTTVLSNLQGNRTTPSGPYFTTYNYAFTGSGSPTTVEFLSNNGNVSHIDNVVLSTPAPGAMVAFGLSAVGARVRRRRSAK